METKIKNCELEGSQILEAILMEEAGNGLNERERQRDRETHTESEAKDYWD